MFERRNLSSVLDDTIADYVHAAGLLDDTVRDITSGNDTDLRNLERVADFQHTGDFFLGVWLQHSFHGRGDFLDALVDDVVLSDFDLLLVCKGLGLRCRTHVESNDDCVLIGSGKCDIAFVDCTRARMDDGKTDIPCRKFFQRTLECLGGTLEVGLDDDLEFLDFLLLDCGVEVVQSDLLECLGILVAFKFLSLCCKRAGILFGLGYLERVSCVRHTLHTENLDWH